ncbi:MAG: carbon-nitrogen hydrolase family protein [Planctomycetes bacterium]|nr:carbon-nitrogen hydrolase family protein [Planctomycetota bacterium]
MRRYLLFCSLLAVLSFLPVQGIEPLKAPVAPRAQPLPKTLRVAAVQMRSTRDLEANLKRTRELLEQCAKDGVQVAVFPECSVSGYFDDVVVKLSAEQLAMAEKSVAAACKEFHIAAIVGMPWREKDLLYNSAIVIDETGKVVERYHKVQLAEPWPSWGDHLSVFRLHGVPCSVIICHDERYPELVRLPVLAGSRVVFYLSHESPIKQESKLNPYRAQIQARAVENGVFIVHANAPANSDATGSHGQSRLIAPDGNILKEAAIFSEEVLSATLELSQATAGNAKRSLSRGPLTQWYAEGVKKVRIIE